MLAPIIEEQGLGAALSFVVTGTHADRIDPPPIGLSLGMDFRIAIDFEVEAWRIRALTRLANLNMLIAPWTLVLVVCTGSI